jgi:hypothetical protein
MEYTDAQVETLLQLYRRLFPKEEDRGWNEVGVYWDFARSRPWSCLTTDVHAVSSAQIRDFDTARRAWLRSDDPREDGQALACLARTHGCGYSVGVSPWTDSALHVTVTPETTKLIVLVGHDWYPIVPMRGPAEARPPLDYFPLLDSADPQWCAYADGMPYAEDFRRARIGLLFLNLVPDFRPPNVSAEGRFPFGHPTAFGYSHCASGLRTAIKLASTTFCISHVVTWSSNAWGALREHAEDEEMKKLSVTKAAHGGGTDGHSWPLGQHVLRIHPFPHPLPSKRHLLWTPGLFDAYKQTWNRLLNGQ